jgi:hypothetical protein
VVGFVVDGVSGKTLGFELLFEGDGRAFREWLEPYAREMGAEVSSQTATTPTGRPSWACHTSCA